MIIEILKMGGYGFYVWLSFLIVFTFCSLLFYKTRKTLKKYELLSGFYAGIALDFPGSGYIDFYEDNILVLSSRGVLAFKKNLEDVDESFKQIKNNTFNQSLGSLRTKLA